MLHTARRLSSLRSHARPSLAMARATALSPSPPPGPRPAAPVVAETQVYARYLSVFKRDVRLPASHGRPVRLGE